MATSISDFDLFSIVESLIKEEKIDLDSPEVPKPEEFIKDSKKQKTHKARKPENGKPMSGNKSKKNDSSKKAQKEEDDDSVDLVDDDKEEVETPDESPSTLKLADALDYKKFVDDLNKFRAAHSFDDEEISKELKDYFQKLEDDEKKAFYVILKGLIQVTLMGVDGKTARTPSELKFSIKKTGNVSSEKRRSMRTKIDTSAELNKKGINKKVDNNVPIKTVTIGDVSDGVVISQDKSKIYEVLRKNNISKVITKD